MKIASSACSSAGLKTPTFLSVLHPNLNYTLSSEGIANNTLNHNIF